MLSATQESPLLGSIDRGCSACVAQIPAQSDFNEYQVLVFSGDQIDFPALATVVTGNDSHTAIVSQPAGSVVFEFLSLIVHSRIGPKGTSLAIGDE